MKCSSALFSLLVVRVLTSCRLGKKRVRACIQFRKVQRKKQTVKQREQSRGGIMQKEQGGATTRKTRVFGSARGEGRFGRCVCMRVREKEAKRLKRVRGGRERVLIKRGKSSKVWEASRYRERGRGGSGGGCLTDRHRSSITKRRPQPSQHLRVLPPPPLTPAPCGRGTNQVSTKEKMSPVDVLPHL